MKRHHPKLSILIPTYNRAEMLRECLESALAAPADTEIIVLDNASSDHTPDVLRAFVDRDQRVRVIRHEQNVGPLCNFQQALEEARGENICLTGDDDVFLPGNFQKKLALLDANPEVGLVYSQWYRIDEQSRSQGVVLWPGVLTYSYLGVRDEFRDLLPASYMMFQSVVFRRGLYEQFGGFDEHPDTLAGNDWDLLLRYCYHTTTAFIAEPLVAVRVHAQSYTESVARKNGKFALGRIAIWRKWLVEHENPPVLDEFLWNRLAQAFLPDLHYEFGQDQATTDHYLHQLELLKRDSIRKVARIALERSMPPSSAAGAGTAHGDGVIYTAHSEARKTHELAASHSPIIWHAPVRDPSGYADEARHFLFALDGASETVAARELRWNDRVALLPADRERVLTRLLAAPAAPDAVHVWHILAPHFQTERTAIANVGRTMFETDRLPDGWADACNRMDAVWVPTEFNRATFARSGVAAEKLRVVPGAIDMTPFDPNVTPLRIDGARGYNFLSIFDWTLRKGWDVLIRAFVEEFRADEDVALLFKIHSSLGVSLEEIVQTVERFLVDTLGRDPNHIPDIVFQDVNIPDSRMPGLYRAADCYVMPTRGEGWGRPFMEAMAMGLTTIGTNWSGQTEFMNSENSLLLDSTLVQVPEPGWREIPTYRGHCWAEPSAAHLRQLMRRAFEDRTGCRQLGARARQDIAERYNYDRIAECIAEEVERLH